MIARLILHGGHLSRIEDALEPALDRLRGEGHRIEVLLTGGPGDAERLAREARDAVDLDTVVAGGGDGTIHQVLQGLVGTDPATPSQGSEPASANTVPGMPSLALLPTGTGNDLARSIGLETGSVEEALRWAVDHPARPVDLGFVGERPFLNVATGGSATRITRKTPDELKRVLGPVAYGLTGLARAESLAPVRGRLRGGDVDFEGSFLALALGNGRFAGGGLDVCPGAELDDGWLEVTILHGVPDGERLDAFGALLRDGRDGLARWTTTGRAQHLTLEVPDGIDLNLDGEPDHRAGEVPVHIAPGQLRLHRPEPRSTTGSKPRR